MTDIENLASLVEDIGGYDLHEQDLGPILVEGWEGFPVRRYRYFKKDPDGTLKAGEVALLDPAPKKIALWTFNSIVAVLGQYNEEKAGELAQHCFDASGFQFPVRGVHWENLTPIFEAYTFFDGVTVKLKGWNPSWPKVPLSQNSLDAAVNSKFEDVAEAMKYSRIQSTSREEYIANGGLLPTDGLHWLSVSRSLYQQAWNSDHNELLTAKACAMFNA